MGFKDSSDVFRRNIYVNTKDGQAWSRHWGTRDLSIQMDYNLYFNYSGDKPIFGIDKLPTERSHGLTMEQWQAKGMDKHSVFAA